MAPLLPRTRPPHRLPASPAPVQWKRIQTGSNWRNWLVTRIQICTIEVKLVELLKMGVRWKTATSPMLYGTRTANRRPMSHRRRRQRRQRRRNDNHIVFFPNAQTIATRQNVPIFFSCSSLLVLPRLKRAASLLCHSLRYLPSFLTNFHFKGWFYSAFSAGLRSGWDSPFMAAIFNDSKWRQIDSLASSHVTLDM